jgi:protein tyrosine phosphatase (PTP) superfamily phosphohydrolase (DUF442 family)
MIESIYNFKQLSPNLATGGQPNENELHQIGKSGYEVVINLGLDKTEYSVQNEKEIIESCGVHYMHIPVSFEAPEVEQYRAFARFLKTVLHKKVFVHCAANKRVSTFMALFRVMEEGWSWKQALDDIVSIWEPNAVWKQFMDTVVQTTDKAAFNALKE